MNNRILFTGVLILLIISSGAAAPISALPAVASFNSVGASTDEIDYYVDFIGGNDNNLGTDQNTPWKHAPGDPLATDTPLNITLNPGDTIHFKGGIIYRGKIVVPAGGIDGNPITYKGDDWGTEKAIIDGSEVLDGWAQCSSAATCGDNPNWEQIYYTDAPLGLEEPSIANLHEGDEFLWLAQEPDMPDPFFMDNIAEFYAIPPTNITRTSLVDPIHLNQTDPHYWDGSSVLVWRNPNLVTSRLITGFSPAEHKITFEDLGGDPYPDRDTKYSIYNSLHALDQAGEYYFEPTGGTNGYHRIYLWPRDLTSLAQGITASVRNIGFDFAGQSFVTIEGFVIQKNSGKGIREGGGISTLSHTTAEYTGLVVRNNLIRHNRFGEYGGYGGIFISQANNSLVENNVLIENPLQRGIFMTGSKSSGSSNCHHNIIRGNAVNKPGATAISFYTCAFSRIVENRIENSLGGHANGMSIYLSSNDILIARNQIFESASPITFQDIHNITIYNNLIDAGELGSNINEWSGNTTGQIAILNNILIRNNRNAALNIGDDAVYIVKNNVIDGGGWSSNTSQQITHTNNLYTGLRWDQEQDDLHASEILEEDLTKIFVNPAALDYRHRVDGPAVDTGEDVSTYLPVSEFPDFDFSLDLVGNHRPWGETWDIGAYELVPDLKLHAIPANQTIYLNWDATVSIPLTTTWMIIYEGTPGDQNSPIPNINSTTRTYTLTDMTNYELYNITLTTVGVTPTLSDTVSVMPTDIQLYLPLVIH